MSSRIARAILAAHHEPPEPQYDPFVLGSAVAAYWASDPAWSHPANGVALTSWRDGSGNGNDLTVSRGTPKYRSSSSLNGQPAVGFSAAGDTPLPTPSDPEDPLAVGGDRLVAPPFAAVIPQPNWWLIVLRYEGTLNSANCRPIDNNGGTARQLVGHANASAYFMQSGTGSAVQAPAISVSTPSWFVAQFSGPTSHMTMNGVEGGVVNPGGGGISNVALGHDTVGSGITGAVAFFGLYTADPMLDPSWPEWLAWCRATYGTG